MTKKRRYTSFWFIFNFRVFFTGEVLKTRTACPRPAPEHFQNFQILKILTILRIFRFWKWPLFFLLKPGRTSDPVLEHPCSTPAQRTYIHWDVCETHIVVLRTALKNWLIGKCNQIQEKKQRTKYKDTQGNDPVNRFQKIKTFFRMLWLNFVFPDICSWLCT